MTSAAEVKAKPQATAEAILDAMKKATIKHGLCMMEFGDIRIQYTLTEGRPKLRINGRTDTYDFAWRALARWCFENSEKAAIMTSNIEALAA